MLFFIYLFNTFNDKKTNEELLLVGIKMPPMETIYGGRKTNLSGMSSGTMAGTPSLDKKKPEGQSEEKTGLHRGHQ